MLIASAQKEVDARHAELAEAERRQIATQIAVGALRYFMLKFTKNSVIAFDFKEALSFEGETGPYCQYAIVRATNIFRKAGLTPEQVLERRFVVTDTPQRSVCAGCPAEGGLCSWPLEMTRREAVDRLF